MVNLYNLWKNQLTSVNVESLDGKDTVAVLFKMRKTYLTSGMFSIFL